MEPYDEIDFLKEKYKEFNLDPDKVIRPLSFFEEPERYVWKLYSMLDWVKKFKQLGNRKSMELAGYDFPPVEPDLSPEDDWMKFLLWLDGKPTRFKVGDRLSTDCDFPPAAMLTDAEVEERLEQAEEALEILHIAFEFQEKLPIRLRYKELLDLMNEEFDEMSSFGTWHVDGCAGYCPDCLRRPWCDNGKTLWEEDKELGRMMVPEEAEAFMNGPVQLDDLDDSEY